MIPRRWATSALIFGALMVGATNAYPFFPSYQTGFESPVFSPGSLEGQDGWQTWPSDLVTVQSNVVRSGSQAVMIDRRSGTAANAYYTVFDDVGQQFSLSVDAYLTDASMPSYWTVLATHLADEFIHINVETDGEIYLFNEGPVGYSTGVFVTRGMWNHFEQRIDLGTRQASIYYNGSHLRTATFGGTATDLEWFSMYGQYDGTNDIGYFDNFSLRSNIPEPSTLGILLPFLAMLGLGLKVRKR